MFIKDTLHQGAGLTVLLCDFNSILPFTAITCTSLSAPSNGDIVFATDTTEPFNYQTTAAYSCNTGYKLLLTVGDRVRICVGSNAGPGEWIGAAPTCEGILLHNKQEL